MSFALDYRMQFGSDVFIDLLGYRKYGHNEGDEPRFTQPVLYKIIAKHQNPRDIYAAKLLEQGVIDSNFVKDLESSYKQDLDDNLQASRKKDLTIITPFMRNEWKGFEQVTDTQMLESVNTSYPKEELISIANVICNLPTDKKFISKIQKLINDRKTMVFETNKLDWAMAEHLAYGSLLKEGYDVRISGQDVERGTFSHRHAVVKVEDSEEEVTLLNNLKDAKGKFHIYNSLLSEYGVLGFDYGYALASPKTLTIWEAQFGDFSNGAQIMIDQYISCGEDKWNNQNGIVLLLPHGYEGQGPEHSSARPERFIQLCAEMNMEVCVPSNASQIYHVLRRQMVRKQRKPLVIMSPKSLLRNKDASCSMDELSKGEFQRVIGEVDDLNPAKVTRVILCSGKVYYDLLNARREQKADHIAIVRIEQLYPFPEESFKNELAKFPKATEIVWCQEEPRNQGFWYWFASRQHLARSMGPKQNLLLVSRPAAASPAVGYLAKHNEQHKTLIESALGKIEY